MREKICHWTCRIRISVCPSGWTQNCGAGTEARSAALLGALSLLTGPRCHVLSIRIIAVLLDERKRQGRDTPSDRGESWTAGWADPSAPSASYNRAVFRVDLFFAGE